MLSPYLFIVVLMKYNHIDCTQNIYDADDAAKAAYERRKNADNAFSTDGVRMYDSQ